MNDTKHTHYSNTRLFVNAGVRIPECRANAKLLDVQSGCWTQTRTRELVTCKHCIRLMGASQHG